jgi:signal peptidase I|tara:strand:- start:9 stop:803 length:795 start_codon:yes stop_codon:yes gene_type:complete
MNFELLLVSLTAISGLIWFADYFLFKLKGVRLGIKNREYRQEKQSFVVEQCISFFPIFLIVLILRSFVFEPFRIPSASMMPTLLIGDFILVNKYEYGLRLPVIHDKFFDIKIPERGDIVVFRYPENPKIPYIKRIVGLPGDKIAYYNKTLYINDILADQTTSGEYPAYGSGLTMIGSLLISENLGNIEHEILIDPERNSLEFVTKVPDSQYLVLGDNRDNSKDSRYWGFVPEQNLVGKAFLIWMNWDRKSKDVVNFRRIGKFIK